MTGPHQLCYVNCGLPADECSCYRDIMSRAGDPAALAALPEVQALIAAAYEVAAKALDHVANNWDCGHMASRLCDCAPLAEQWGIAAGRIRALTPAEATAALAARDAAMIARGMRRAAAALIPTRGATLPYQQAAILARAAEIERDAK